MRGETELIYIFEDLMFSVFNQFEEPLLLEYVTDNKDYHLYTFILENAFFPHI